MMWTTSLLSSPSRWPSCIHHLCTKSPQGLSSLAVSAQSQNDHLKYSTVGQVHLTASKSNAKHQSSSSSSSSLGSLHDSPGQQRPLTGSDVLLALRKATAEKSKKKEKGVSFTPRAPKVGKNGQDEAAADYNSSIRPLNIKTEWIVRLEQLEKRLQQLMDA